MAKRKLSADEKKQIIESVRASQQARHPTTIVHVRVDEDTDDDGQPVIHVDRAATGMMPPSWRKR